MHSLRALTAAKRAKSPRTTEFLSASGESNLRIGFPGPLQLNIE